jgi:hypothetical protein
MSRTHCGYAAAYVRYACTAYWVELWVGLSCDAAVTFEICYRKVLDSNLARDTRYAHSCASWFFSATPVQYHDSTSIRPWQLPSTSFPFHYSLIVLPLDAIRYTDSIRNKSCSRFFTHCCSYILPGKQFNGVLRYKKVYYKQVSVCNQHTLYCFKDFETLEVVKTSVPCDYASLPLFPFLFFSPHSIFLRYCTSECQREWSL